MNRFSFRAWDKERETMVMVLDMTFMFESEDGIRINGYTNNRIDHNVFPEHLILMQSTGLKDKNGFEIFEGDIVGYMYAAEAGDEKLAGVVAWDSYYAGWTFDRLFLEPTPKKTMEIIGNIYENPELLEAQ